MICQQGFVFQSYKCLGVTCETLEGKKIFRVEEGVKGRHFFVLNFSPPMKGEITKIQIAQQEPSLVLEIFAFLLCWRRNQEMSKLSLFCCVSPRFFVLSYCLYMNSSPFYKSLNRVEKSEKKTSWRNLVKENKSLKCMQNLVIQ